MPRVTHVKKARKDNTACKAGESYYWWSFRFGGKHYSKNYPKRSQLTQSEFLSQMYEIEDDILGKADECKTVEDLQSLIEEATSALDSLSSEEDDKFQNMPEGLQYGPTGELLEERSQGSLDMVSELEDIDLEYDPETDGDKAEWLEGKIEEVAQISYQGG